MLSVTKQFSFCYGHHLPGYSGRCKTQHGHNSTVEVEITNFGAIGYPGMVVDFSIVKQIAGEIVDQLDHQNLNELGFIEGNPTAENIVMWVVGQIKKTEIGPGLVRVRMTETPTSWAEWKEDKYASRA